MSYSPTLPPDEGRLTGDAADGEPTDLVPCPPAELLDGDDAGPTSRDPTDRIDISSVALGTPDPDEPTERAPPLALLPRPPRLPRDPHATPRLARGSEPELGRRTPRDARPPSPPPIPRPPIPDPRPPLASDGRPASEPPPPPCQLGNYRITGVLASGGMGVVYRAEHVAVGMPVAIKAAHGRLRRDLAVAARFTSEAVATARVVHRNVVRFFDFGYDDDGCAYLVTELLDGETLSQRLARERTLDVETAIEVAIQIAHGLAAAHAHGVVHRDLKPDNIFLAVDPGEPGGIVVKLLDFGVAKIAHQGAVRTQQGELLGTPAYMAPEQGRSAAESDPRSDLYSLGCILFEMVCGVVPFPGNLVETLLGHQSAERPPARALNPAIPRALELAIDRLLARDPSDRPMTAIDVVRALAVLRDRARDPTPASHRAVTERIRVSNRAPLTAAIVAIAAALGVLAAIMTHG